MRHFPPPRRGVNPAPQSRTLPGLCMKDYLLRTAAEIQAAFPQAGSYSRYLGNASRGLTSATNDYTFVFYLAGKECCGIAVKRRGRSEIPEPMVQSFLYGALRNGTWAMLDSSRTANRRLKMTRNWEFTPTKDQPFAKAFAQHQSGVGQLIIWDPSWMPPLEEFSASPMA